MNKLKSIDGISTFLIKSISFVIGFFIGLFIILIIQIRLNQFIDAWIYVITGLMVAIAMLLFLEVN